MTNNSRQVVFVDQEVSNQILGVIDQARQHVVIVSPYLDIGSTRKTPLGAQSNGALMSACICVMTRTSLPLARSNGSLALGLRYSQYKGSTPKST